MSPTLPVELIIAIFKYISAKEILQTCMLINKKTNQLLNTTDIWTNLCNLETSQIKLHPTFQEATPTFWKTTLNHKKNNPKEYYKIMKTQVHEIAFGGMECSHYRTLVKRKVTGKELLNIIKNQNARYFGLFLEDQNGQLENIYNIPKSHYNKEDPQFKINTIDLSKHSRIVLFIIYLFF